MNLVLWIVLAVGMLSAAAPMSLGGLRPVDERRLRKYTDRVGLPLPSGLRAPLVQRITFRERWVLGGGAVGLAVGLLVAASLGWNDPANGLVLMVAIAFGGSLGGVAAILRGGQDLTPDAPRVARTTVTVLGDYLAPGELLTVRLAPAAAIVSAVAGSILLAVLGTDQAPDATATLIWLTWASVAMTCAVWAGTEILGRRVLLRPQRASSQLELAWDDVCRAEALRAMFANTIVLAAGTCIVSLFMVGVTVIDPDVRHDAMDLTATLGLIMLAVSVISVVGMLIPGLTVWVGPYRRRVLQRLWTGQFPTPGGA